MRRFVKRAINLLLRPAGYELQPLRGDSVFCSDQAEFNRFHKMIASHSMLSKQRLASLYDQVKYCEEAKIEGAYVECGVWRGGAVALMGLVNLAHGMQRRHLHLFDSFEGIPEPDATRDGARAVREAARFGTGTTGRLIANPQFYTRMGRAVGRLEDSRKLLEDVVGYEKAFVHFHQGFFQTTVPAGAPQIGPIAILRLDGDWYGSTKVCLDFLYDHVVAGGFVIIDDFGAYEGCRAAVADFQKERRCHFYLHPVDSECRAANKSVLDAAARCTLDDAEAGG